MYIVMFIVCRVCFFLKQKTAYDMRISDWSSDVCSSDLNRPLKFEEWEQMRPESVFVSATPGPWEMGRTGGVFTEQVIRPTGLIDQIGRASCRERVGQEV